MYRKITSAIVIGAIMISLVGCGKFFNTKDIKDDSELNEVQDIGNIVTPTIDITEVKDLDSISINGSASLNDIDDGKDAEDSEAEDVEIKSELQLDDGSIMIVDNDAYNAINEYIKKNNEIKKKNYPQENEIKVDSEFAYETTVDAYFEITKITFKTVKYSENSQAMLYSSIIGRIAGLDGEYEIEIPYNVAINLKVGDKFAISYQTVRIDNKVVITNIKY